MSDEKNTKQNNEEEVSPRKRVKVVDEVVDDEASEEEEPSAQGKKDYTTEHQAGSKVRVARSVDNVSSSQSGEGKKPGRRAVAIEDKKKEEEADENGEAQEQSAEQSSESQERQKDAAEGRDDSANEQVGAAGQKPQVDTDDIQTSEPEVTTEDFEALLAGQSATSQPRTKDIAAGDRIKGTVVAIGEQFIFVEFGSSKSEGVAKREDFETEEGELQVEMGDELEFYVLGLDGDEIRLGKKLGGREGALEAIRNAHDTGVPIEGRVADTNKGGFEIQIGSVRAFCPISQIELGYTEEPQVHVGNTYRFRVQRVAEGGRNIVVSRSALLEEEQAAKREETLESLEEDEVVSGKVTRVVDFGAFVDLGGIEGLVHVSELAHGFFDKPSDVVSPGETIDVKILEIDKKDDDEVRISLSRKETEGDPWEEVNKKFSVGDQVEGEVVRLAPFGAFVEVSPGVDGLVHVSEMSWKEHVKHPRDVVTPGETIMVEIQDIDQARKRISLSMKAVEGDPWDTATERYSQGMEVTGLVENIEDFGVFVRLDSGITALLPRSEMDLPSGVTPHRKYTPGEDVTARVLDVDPGERKMALTEKAAEDIQSSGGSKKSKKSGSSGGGQTYSDDSGGGGGFGTLGDLLGDKLDNDD